MLFEVHPSPAKGKDGKNIVYVKPVSGQKITMRQLEEFCSKRYGIRYGELARAFDVFIQGAGFWLSEGYRIETPIGWFSPKIGLRDDMEFTNPDQVKGKDVRFEGIEYKSVKDFEDKVLTWLEGFRRANNPNTQDMMADESHLERALNDSLKRLNGYTTARSFAYHANITYYSARKQLDNWCKGDNPRLLKTKRGQEYIYTEV